MSRKQIHLGAHFPGANNTTVWSDPESGSQTDFSSFVHFARNAERGLMDFLFLAEGLRLNERRGRIHELDVVGRPDTFTVLNAVAAMTTSLGLAGTINTTFNEPYELAKQFASLDHLSRGRAAWNMATTSDGLTGRNFRRGGFLEHAQRYERAAEMVAVTRLLWDSWRPDGLQEVVHHGRHFDVRGRFALPASPQGHPVLIQSGDSTAGRDFAAATADAIFSLHNTLDAGRRFYADVKGRLARHARRPDDLLVLAGLTFALGDTEDDARENADRIRRAQVSPATALAVVEKLWGRDLSSYDPEGPLPDVDPDVGNVVAVGGRSRRTRDPRVIAAEWRDFAASRGGLSIREVVLAKTGREAVRGTPRTVAAKLDELVQGDACDGFIVIPCLNPGGLDRFVDEVIPELQDRGSYRTAYSGPTLRDNLGLCHPAGRSAVRATPPRSNLGRNLNDRVKP